MGIFSRKQKWHELETETLSNEVLNETIDDLDVVFEEPRAVYYEPKKLTRSDPQIRSAYARGYQAGRRYKKK